MIQTITVIDSTILNEDPELDPIVVSHDVDLDIDLPGGKLSYAENGINKELVLKSFNVDAVAKRIPVSYAEVFKNVNGDTISAVPHVFDAVNNESWDHFYTTLTGESQLGDTLMQMCINGIAMVVFGVYLFE